jgi:hypothetical protein
MQLGATWRGAALRCHVLPHVPLLETKDMNGAHKAARAVAAWHALFAAMSCIPCLDAPCPCLAHTPRSIKCKHPSEQVRKLLAGGGPPDAERDSESRTALHLAALNGHAEVVRALLKAKASANWRAAKGRKPLHLAAERGHAEAVRALAEGPASLTSGDELGATPLHLAAESNHVEVRWGIWAGCCIQLCVGKLGRVLHLILCCKGIPQGHQRHHGWELAEFCNALDDCGVPMVPLMCRQVAQMPRSGCPKRPWSHTAAYLACLVQHTWHAKLR